MSPIKLNSYLLVLLFSFLLLVAGLAYFLYLQFVFPSLVPHHGEGERFVLSETKNGTYTFQISWSAYTRLHLTLQANKTVELYVNGTYLCDCSNYDIVIEEGGRALIYLRSDVAVSGMFKAWQEIPLERQLFALILMVVGFLGTVISIGMHIKKARA
jgi:hypothetical protein